MSSDDPIWGMTLEEATKEMQRREAASQAKAEAQAAITQANLLAMMAARAVKPFPRGMRPKGSSHMQEAKPRKVTNRQKRLARQQRKKSR